MATPLVVCMQNSGGEEVALNVEPGDDFSTFLRKAKELLGFEIDISCITKNQVSLSENIYDFLVNADEEHINPTILRENAESVPESLSIYCQSTNDNCILNNEAPSEPKTQNDDASMLDVKIIPFVKYTKAEIKEETPVTPHGEITVTIIQSPTHVLEENPTSEFLDNLPFKPVSNNILKNVMGNRQNFEVHQNYERNNAGIQVNDLPHLTRNQVLSFLKNSPVIKTIEIINDERKEIQNHVRKTAPNKLSKEPAQNNLTMDATMTLRRRYNKNICFICNELVQSQFEEIYVFNSEDQKACRSSPKKEQASPLKVACNACLEKYFIYCTELFTERTLESDEYLVIRRNQQYLYKIMIPLPIQTEVTQILLDENKEINRKPTEIKLLDTDRNEDMIKIAASTEKENNENEKNCRPKYLAVVGNPIGVSAHKTSMTDEVITIDSDENDDGNEGKAGVPLLFKENDNAEENTYLKIIETKSCSNDTADIDIVNIEAPQRIDEKYKPEKQEYDEVEFLEDFEDLSKELSKELKCRFCNKVFDNLDCAVEHGTEHRLEKENVFPCPLCEYGYQTYVWLRGHMYSKHETGVYVKREEATTPTPSNVSINSEDIPENTKGTPDNLESIPENSKAILENLENILENSEDILENSEDILENTEGTPENSEGTPENQSPVATRTRSSTARKRPASRKKKETNVMKSKKSKISGNADDPIVANPTTSGKKIKDSKRRKEEKHDTDDEPWTVESKARANTSAKNTDVSKRRKEEKHETDDEPWTVESKSRPTTSGKNTKASKRRKEEEHETDDEPLTAESKPRPTTSGKKTKPSKRRNEEKHETDDEPLTVEGKSSPTTSGKKTKASKRRKEEEKHETDEETVRVESKSHERRKEEEKHKMDDEPLRVESKFRNEETTSSPEKHEVNKTYSCPFCKKRFISKATLCSHEARNCKMPKMIVYKNGCVTVTDSTRMPSEKALYKRMKQRGPNKDQVLDENTGVFHQMFPNIKMKYDRHLNTSVMTCDYCKKTFTSKVRLKYHMQFHRPSKLLTEEGHYLCEKCPSTLTFTTESELFDHVHFTHEKRRRWLCPVIGCRKTFFLRAMLTKHSRKHTDTRRYICTQCGKRFLDKQTLDEHSVTHLQTKPFQCHICLKHLTRRSRLRMHLRSHEECLEPKPLRVCRLCSRAFKNLLEAQEHAVSSECSVKMEDSKELLHQSDDMQPKNILDLKISEEIKAMAEEMSEETGRVITVVTAEKVLRCEYCDDVFFQAEKLNSHRVQHRDVANPFICHICKVTFPTYARCTTHKTTHGYYKRPLDPRNPPQKPTTIHVVNTEQTNNSKQINESKETDDPKQKIDTEKKLDRKEMDDDQNQTVDLKQRADIKETVEPNKTVDLEQRADIKQTVDPNETVDVEQRTDIKGTVDPNETVDLRQRADIEQTDPNQTFKPKYEFGFPSDIVGYGDFPVAKHFLCEDCGRSYLHWTYLQVHRRFKHPTAGQVFVCSDCGHTFSNSWGLSYHKRRAHAPNSTGEVRIEKMKPESKPTIPCRDCQETFTNKSALYTHRKKLHPKGFGALTKATLVGSSTTAPATAPENNTLECPASKELICGVCVRVFRSASECEEHQRVHTAERPFPCDVCGLTFRRATARNNHRLIHTGEKAFPCSSCDKSYRIRSDLKAHVKAKHAEQTLVLEMCGLNPDPAEVIMQLRFNNIVLDKVVQVSKVSYAKGSTNLVMSGDASALVNVDEQDHASRLWSDNLMETINACCIQRPKLLHLPVGGPPRALYRGARGPYRSRQPKPPETLQLQYKDTNTCHVQLNHLAIEEVTQLLGGVLTNDGKGILLTSGRFVPFEAVSLNSSKTNHNQPMEDIQQMYDPDCIAQPVQQDLYIGEGITQSMQESFYIPDSILQPVQQSFYNLEGISQALQQNLYTPDELAQVMQQSLYIAENILQPVPQSLYDPEGIKQAVQQNLYSPEGITQAMQQNFYTPEGITQAVQQNLYTPEDITHSVQQNLYTPEGITQAIHQNLYNPEGIAQAVQQSLCNPEDITQALQQNLYNPEGIAQAQQSVHNKDGMVELPQGYAYKIEVQHERDAVFNSDNIFQAQQDETLCCVGDNAHSIKQDLCNPEGNAQTPNQNLNNQLDVQTENNAEPIQHNLNIPKDITIFEEQISYNAQVVHEGSIYNQDGNIHLQQVNVYNSEQNTNDPIQSLNRQEHVGKTKAFTIENEIHSPKPTLHTLQNVQPSEIPYRAIAPTIEQYHYRLPDLQSSQSLYNAGVQTSEQNMYNFNVNESMQLNNSLPPDRMQFQQNIYYPEGYVQENLYNIEENNSTSQRNLCNTEGNSQSGQSNIENDVKEPKTETFCNLLI